MKKRKFFYLTISLIALILSILLYEKSELIFSYLMVVFFCLPFACGLAWLKEGIALFYIKFIKPGISKRAAFLSLPQNTSNLTQCRKRKFIALKTVFFLFFFIAVTLFPLHLFAANFKAMVEAGVLMNLTTGQQQ